MVVVDGDTLLDIGVVMRDAGIEIPDGGWVVYGPRTLIVIARLDALNVDLIDQLIGVG